MRRVTEIGVDEVACLIDFGIDTDLVLENLPNIKALMDGLQAEGGVSRKVSVADDVVDQAPSPICNARRRWRRFCPARPHWRSLIA